jgi:hypothetical protein
MNVLNMEQKRAWAKRRKEQADAIRDIRRFYTHPSYEHKIIEEESKYYFNAVMFLACMMAGIIIFIGGCIASNPKYAAKKVVYGYQN